MAIQQFPLPAGGIPSGNTANRPSSPVIGDTYYDGTLGFLLIWDGTKWLPCSAPAAQPSIAVTDVGTGVAYGTVQGSVAFTEGLSGGKAEGFTAIQGSFSTTGTTSPLVVTTTGNPGSYSFTGTSYNGFGTSPQAVSQTATLTSVPQAPTIGTATPGTTTTQITVTWTNGATGGKNLSAITITPFLNGTTAETARTAATTSSTSYTFTEGQLTTGSSYTFKVKATNANGNSADSAASNSATMLPTQFTVDYLVIAGGGGGGGDAAGGGGAGGYRTSAGTSGANSAAESSLSASGATNYSVTVGAGGAGNTGTAQGTDGSSSTFNTITSTGGGGGGGSVTRTGRNGGSGGGAGLRDNISGGAGTANQGFAGGASCNGSVAGGGGGGAGAAGIAGQDTNISGIGGTGIASTITGSSVFRAGGGGGEGDGAPGAGGAGGGGEGGAPGTANTGGGGGGGFGSGGDGAAGGSGVVILRYPDSRTITIGAGLTGTESAASGGFKRATITAGTGNVSWN